MRQYQPIWEQLRKTGTATLVAPTSSHSRIIQAVRKEKWRDAGFRLLMSEKGIRFLLMHTVDRKKGIISFKLQKDNRIRLENL